jgi:hypothetical protein
MEMTESVGQREIKIEMKIWVILRETWYSKPGRNNFHEEFQELMFM